MHGFGVVSHSFFFSSTLAAYYVFKRAYQPSTGSFDVTLEHREARSLGNEHARSPRPSLPGEDPKTTFLRECCRVTAVAVLLRCLLAQLTYSRVWQEGGPSPHVLRGAQAGQHDRYQEPNLP